MMRVVGVSEAPDIYTAAIGLYTVWLVLRAVGTLLHYMSQGLSTFAWQIGFWSLQVSPDLFFFALALYTCMRFSFVVLFSPIALTRLWHTS